MEMHENLKFAISQLKLYEDSVFCIIGWCFAEKRIDSILVCDLYSKDGLVGTQSTKLELERIRQKGKVDFHFEDKSIHTGRFEKGNEVIISVGEQNHFHPDYRKAGDTWTIPRLDKQREEFLKARQMYEAAGGKIYNASRQTKLDAWERVDFDQVISRGGRSTRNMVSNI